MGKKDPQNHPFYRRFLTEEANKPPSALVRIFPEHISTSADSKNDDNTTAQEKSTKVSLSDFELVRVLGKGSFGKVTLVRKKTNQKLYAMKGLSKSYIIKRKQVEHTKTERRVLGRIDHPFIVKLHFAFQTEEKLYFVLDYAAGGELFFHLSRMKKFPEATTKFYCAELTLALDELHAHVSLPLSSPLPKFIFSSSFIQNVFYNSDPFSSFYDCCGFCNVRMWFIET